MPYYPKGGRCAACTRRTADCSRLPFESMPVHRRDGSTVVVICTEFQPAQNAASLRDFHSKRRPRGGA